MNISSSIRRLTQLFVALFIALSGGLVYWQVVVADQVTSNIHNSRHCLYANAPKRGNIYDRNGVLLAESIPSPDNGCGYVRKYTDPSLAGLIGYYVSSAYPSTGLENVYNNVLDGDTNSSELTNTVNHLLHRAPVGDNIYLTIDERIQKIVAQDYTIPTPDSTYQYTGVTIQDPAQTLNDGMTDGTKGYLLYHSDRGSVVVTDPQTGEILAMLSSPYYDPNKMVQTLASGDQSYFNQLNAETLEDPLLYRPTQQLYTPGSTFKAMTLLAGLDSGKITLQQEWSKDQAYGDNGVITVQGTPITGDNLGFNVGAFSYTFTFPITTEYAFENSDNLVFANAGLDIGADTWTSYASKMYLDQKIPFDLPVVMSHVQHTDGSPLTQYELAAGSFGQGINQVTPLQMSLIDNVAANDGVLMQPLLVAKVTDAQGNVITSNGPRQLNQVVSATTAQQTRQAMQAVTDCGGGFPILPIRNTQWGIIGKTGTGQVGGSQAAEGWMITQAPYFDNDPGKQPQLTIVAMKENSGEGAYSVGPMIAKMYSDIFGQNLISNVQQPTNPTADSYCLSNKLWQTTR